MAVEIRVPTLGESIVEATIGKWLKQVGDAVSQGEALVELETDKVNVEVMAEQAGVLGSIDKPEGAEVAIGQVIGTLSAQGEAPAATPAAEPAAPQTVAGQTPVSEAEEKAVVVDTHPAAPAPEANGRPSEAAASPVARNMAAANNVDLATVQGSGPGGRVLKDDISAQLGRGAEQPAPAVAPAPKPAAAAAAPAPKPAAAAPAAAADSREERVKMSRRRQTIARRLVEAQRTAAMLTTFNEVDMTAIMELRKKRGDAFLKRNNVKLGFMSFFTKAVVGALKAFPLLNAEIQGDELLIKHHYDIGIAVGAEEGLVVPVVRNADSKNFAALESEIADLGKRARANTLGIADLQGGTFTITNGGIFGSLMSTPILNAPQVGILGMHGIKERPIVVNGEIAIRPMMYLALSYDHRIVDGSEAVRFLVRIKEFVEDPEQLLLEA